MKTSSKIAIAAAAVGAWLLAKKKGAISGIGALADIKYIVYFDPGWRDTNFVWLHDQYGLQNDRNHATRYDTYEEAQMRAQEFWNERYAGSYNGFKVMEIKDHDEKRVKRAIDELLRHDDRFRYSMLDRMRMDCDYYLGNGDRHGQYLWMSMDPQGHIDVMRALWNSFDEDKKPEWLSMEQIDKYAEQMGVGKIEHSDYNGARIISKDGLHAISFDIYGRGESGITVTSEMKGDGSRYGFRWEFLSHIGDYKTLSGAIKAAKKYWDRGGIEYDPKDFEKL